LKRAFVTKVLFCFLFLIGTSFAQPSIKADNWNAWKFIIGEWIGEGSGSPGEATGSSIFSFDLQNTVIIRKSFADYPAANNRLAFNHDDLMIIYQESKSTKAIYFDNEGHVINYEVTLSQDGNSIIFVSDINLSTPRFRFTYSKIENNRMKFIFDFAPPGKPEEFSKYLEGTVRKKI
jgi:hypothetical protein